MSGKHSSVKRIEAGVDEVPIGGTGGIGGIGTACTGEVIVLPSIVTAPVKPIALPVIAAPVPKDTEDNAITSPCMDALALMVAELPTSQMTFLANVPFVRTTVALVLMVSEEPIWKMNTALGSPLPFKVRVPPTDKSMEIGRAH